MTVFKASFISPTSRYTSEDLALLPCEDPADPFFYPVEFTKEGSLAYPYQIDDFAEKLHTPDVKDVFVVIHGWDKTSRTAERDYQDFVCRLQKYSRRQPEQEKSLILGIFWPSTFWPNYGDPSLCKVVTYALIRDRAAHIGRKGLGGKIIRLFATLSGLGKLHGKRFHFICHSFGAKMALAAFQSYLETTRLRPHGRLGWLWGVHQINFVLLLPAVRRGEVPSLMDLSAKVSQEQGGAEILREWFAKVNIFIVHSENDIPNRWLFPAIEWRQSIGTAGEQIGKRMVVTEQGSLQKVAQEKQEGVVKDIHPPEAPQPMYMNVDASKFIYGHGDIYKGRVAKLVWDLLRTTPEA